MSENYIPDEFKFSHHFCFFLHDQIVGLLKEGEEAEIFETIVKLNKKHKSVNLDQFDGEELLDWLDENGYHESVDTIFYKQLASALVSDFLHFVYEALKCSEKNKLTVAYALLRKPFKENLFFLEWLLSDPEDFLKRFKLNEEKRFSFSYENSKESKIDIIRRAMLESKDVEWFDADIIYDIRYQKTAHYGLESTWQKASHLVTTFKHLKTEECNLNMIFSNEYSWSSQWEGLYSTLPLLLTHALYVITGIFDKFCEFDETFSEIWDLRTKIGFVFWVNENSGKTKITKELKNIFPKDKLQCNSCKEELNIELEDLKLFYEVGSFICPACLEPIVIKP